MAGIRRSAVATRSASARDAITVQGTTISKPPPLDQVKTANPIRPWPPAAMALLATISEVDAIVRGFAAA